MNKKYVIFDMDGTLLDSMGFWYQLPQLYLSSLGDYQIFPDQLDRLMKFSLADGSVFLSEEFSLARTSAQVESDLNAMIQHHYTDLLQPKAAVPAYLAGLAAQGVKMCVASATPQPLIEACFTRLGLMQYLEFCLSCVEENTDKSRPDLYLTAAERLGAKSPAEAAVFEDALFAVRTAKKAGFYTVGVQDAAEAENWPEICRLADETIRFDVP